MAGSGAAQVDGGRDISVALFSSLPVKSVVAAPLSANAWTARCATCAHQAFTRPIIVAQSMEIFAGGTLRVTDEASHTAKTATGLWHVRANAASRDVDVVLTLPSERYVAAVLNAEVSASEPPASLRAMAILVRTYAFSGKHYTSRPGHLAADMCDSTACQAMKLQRTTRAIEDATRATAGETLWFGARRADVFFSQSCGGFTESADAVWPTRRRRPYLKSHDDPYCLRRDRDAWNAQVPLATFASIAKSEGWRVPAQIASARILQRSSSHRALKIEFDGDAGEKAALSASALRFGIGRALGWNRVRSDSYELGVRNGALVFDGRGHGHGVGLCQTGAAEMATEGKSTEDILGFYFPGTVVRILPKDTGWQETHTSSLLLRTTASVAASRQSELEQVWQDAQRRFPPRRPLKPTLVFAPSTEVFRQMTSEAGWTLASTQGSVIVLQPEDVLRANQRNEAATVRHEMLHVLVETQSGEHAPLWLREGLVEVLAGDASPATKPASTAQIEAELLHPTSLQANERAHLAAAAKVQGLISRYGVATVRGWLASGPPGGVS
jgi:stage II sporulation protein D